MRAAVEDGRLEEIDGQDVRYGPPIQRPGKLICIGLNYEDHAAESAMAVPTEPVIFFKASNTIVGPKDDVLIPRGSDRTDYEAELAVVIGKTARYLDSVDGALDFVAGYAISNDVSERTFQLERGGQWVKGKSCETFNPLGPWLVTADEVGDPQALGLRLRVNGDQRHAVLPVGFDRLCRTCVLEPAGGNPVGPRQQWIGAPVRPPEIGAVLLAPEQISPGDLEGGHAAAEVGAEPGVGSPGGEHDPRSFGP